jgi:hypothetical protein
MKKKIKKSKMAATSGLLFYSYISAAMLPREKVFEQKVFQIAKFERKNK